MSAIVIRLSANPGFLCPGKVLVWVAPPVTCLMGKRGQAMGLQDEDAIDGLLQVAR